MPNRKRLDDCVLTNLNLCAYGKRHPFQIVMNMAQSSADMILEGFNLTASLRVIDSQRLFLISTGRSTRVKNPGQAPNMVIVAMT
jgi:hypothetical protein